MRKRLRQLAIRVYDRLGPYAEASVVGAIGSTSLIVMMWFQVGGPVDWAGWLATIVLMMGAVFVTRRASRQQAILIEITLSYLVRGGKPFLDHVLRKLMGGRWRRERLKPGAVLFDVFDEICRSPDWDMRRLVAEALPALAQINAKRAATLAAILREDWEPARWKVDLRRRAVEAITTPAPPGRTSLMDFVALGDVACLLQLREKDDVFTAMAVAEALSEWENRNPKNAPRLQAEMLEYGRRMLSSEENEAIRELVELLRISRGDIFQVIEKIEQMAESPNMFTRVAAARNVLLLSDRFPEKTLDLLLKFADLTQHRYVRRPVARDRSVEFIIRMIGRAAYKNKAEKLLLSLYADPDPIVPATVLDKAEMLKDYNRSLLSDICGRIIEIGSPAALVERAHQVKQDLVDTDHAKALTTSKLGAGIKSMKWSEFDRGMFLCNVLGIIYDPNTRQVLIGRRTGDPYIKELSWCFPGGRPGYEDDLEYYLRREIKVKTGLEVAVKNIVYAKTYPEKREFLSVYYNCEVIGGTEKPGEKFAEIKWVKPTEVQKYFTTSLHPQVLAYLRTLE